MSKEVQAASLAHPWRKHFLACMLSRTKGTEGGTVQATARKEGSEAVVLFEVDPGPVEMPRCPVCACSIDEEPVICPRCATPHHRECWDYAEGCAIFGCDSRGWKDRALDLGAFDAMLSRTRQWSRLFRYQWIAFALAAAAIVVTLCGATLPHQVYWRLAKISHIASWLSYFGRPFMVLGSILCQLSVVSYLVLLIPAWSSRRELEERLGSSLVAPREGSRALLDRVQTPPMARLLGWVMGACSTVAILFSLGLLWVHFTVPAQLQLVSGLGEILTLLLLGIAFPLGATIASRMRLAYVQTVQNRVQASLKGQTALLKS